MKTGPHRKLQVFQGPEGQTQGTIESPDTTPRTKSATISKLHLQGLSQNLGGLQTPTQSNTIASGRSADSKIIASSQVQSDQHMASPRSTFAGVAQQREKSASQTQLSYTLISASGSSVAVNKSYQPVLKKEKVSTKTLTSDKSTGVHHRRQQYGSGSTFADKAAHFTQQKSSASKLPPTVTQQIIIKEQPFNYEERKRNQKSAEQLQTKSKYEDSLKDVTKSLQYERTTPEIRVHEADFGKDEIFHMTPEDRDEVRMRPSEEVSIDQQFLLYAIGSGFSHSRIGSGQNWNNKKVDEVEGSSYQAFVEEHKSDAKTQQFTQNDEKFEVIREDLKDSFYSPKLVMYDNPRDNSDFKKFNADEESQAMDSKWLQRIDVFSKNHSSVENTKDNIHRLEIIEDQHEFEETPKNFKDRVMKSFVDQKPDSLVVGGASNNLFSQGNNQLSSVSNFNKQKHNMDQHKEAHALSFSEDNPPMKQKHPVIPPLTLQQLANMNDSSVNNTHANTIIEIEKNYVIMQYETLLQQLSAEFQKVLVKTKETDEHLAQQELLIQTQQKIIQDKEATQFQHEQVTSQLSNQVSELLREMEQLTIDKQRRQQSDMKQEEREAERDYLEQTVQTLQSKVRMFESSEICLKDKIESLQAKDRQVEQKLRHKDEELFAFHRLINSHERDLQSMKEIENSLKLELQRNQTARLAMEEGVQDMRQRSVADQVLLRLRENEIESMNREYKAIKGHLESLQLSYAQVMRENDQLKGTINEHERANIQMKSLFQTRDQQTQHLETDIQRLTTIIDKERQRSNKVEEDYRRKIDTLQLEMRDLQAKKDNMEVAIHRSYDNRAPTINFQDTLQNSMRLSFNNEPQSNVLSPRKEEAKISWLYPAKTNEQQHLVVPQVQQQQQYATFDESQAAGVNNPMLNRRKTTVNNQNNTSQITDLFAWENKPQNRLITSQGAAQSYKSLERPNANQYFGQPRPSLEPLNLQQNSNHGSNNNTQFSPRGGVQNPNKNSFQASGGEQQAAGMKSKAETSPFYVSQEGQQKQIGQLQNTLSSMIMDKERIENEYRKLGTSKNKQQIDKKRELEFDIEVIDKNLHQIKQKLREMNAL